MGFKRELIKIDWMRDAAKIHVTNEEYAALLQQYRLKGQKANTKTKYLDWNTNWTYREDEFNKYRYLYTYLLDNVKAYGKAFCVFSTNTFDDSKNSKPVFNKGLNSSILVEKKFKELYGTSLIKAFGYCPKEIRHCTPKQFYFVNKKLLGYQDHVSSIDICSHYPNSISGVLPDWHTAVEHEGTVEPTEEYPFAFYINSGHIAEYCQYDSHNWLNHKLAGYLFDDSNQKTLLNPNMDRTVLCKSSKYELTDIMRYYYNKKVEGDSDAKLVMNSFIGNLHTNAYRTYRMAHLAAIAIARANARMLELVDSIGYWFIVQACVDGIIYKSSKALGGSTKKIGDIYQEYTDAEIYIKSINSYIVRQNGKYIKAKHSSMNSWIDGRRIGTEEELLNQIQSIEDVDKWKRIEYLEM